MKHYFSIVTLFAMVVVGVFAGTTIGHPQPVYAYSPGCDAINAMFPMPNNTAYMPGPLDFVAGETIYYSAAGTWPNFPTETFVSINDSVTSANYAGATAPGNFASTSYTIPADGAYSFRFDWMFFTEEPYTPHMVYSFVSCGYRDEPTPAGFKLKTITCDVAVYDKPAGSPVADNTITNGQTWYVNPTPVQGTDGQSWSEIFVAGPINGFIPTSCVQ